MLSRSIRTIVFYPCKNSRQLLQSIDCQTARPGHYGHNPRVVIVVTVVTAGSDCSDHQTTRRHIHPWEICRPSKKGGKKTEKGAWCPQSIILLNDGDLNL
eukprot:scaffold8174_cov83-Skeletonema_dohrnii-CCMP3373.AAC.2